METHPPKLIESLIAPLIPPACRESVIGDWAERSTTTAQYILAAVATLPFIIVSQIRRTLRLERLFSEASVLLIAFAGASIATGSGGVHGGIGGKPLAIVVCVALLVLVLRDAYVDLSDSLVRRALRDVGLSIGAAVFCEGLLLSLGKSGLALSSWAVIAGCAAAIPMLYMLRLSQSNGEDSAPASGPRSSQEEHRNAWRLNLAWVIASLVVIFTDPNINGSNGGNAISGLILIAVVTFSFWKHKNGLGGPGQESRALSISRDPYKDQLERKRDGLRFWAGGGALSSGAATLIMVLIVVPYVPLVFSWLAGRPFPVNVSLSHVWLSLIAFSVLSAFWIFVRSRNLRAAQAIQDELDRLDAEDKKR